MFKTVSLSICALIACMLAYGCTGGGDGKNSSNPCRGRENPRYHISYFEICGNSEKPVSNGREKTVTLWFEVDSPFSPIGKVWVDDIYLERSDSPGVNLLSNSSLDSSLLFWPHHENAMCLAEDTWCQNITEFTRDGIWSLDGSVFHSVPSAARADIGLLGQGYQTHIFQYPLINIEGIPAGVEFRAHAFVKIEGDAQVRLGIDFREAEVDPSNPRAGIRAVNGRIIQGATDWIKLNLR